MKPLVCLGGYFHKDHNEEFVVCCLYYHFFYMPLNDLAELLKWLWHGTACFLLKMPLNTGTTPLTTLCWYYFTYCVSLLYISDAGSPDW